MNKNITPSAEETIVQQARRCAIAENTTLNELFRMWLERYISQPMVMIQYRELMPRFDQVTAGRSFSREDMNERR